ncbi:hypothetical protein CEXT_464261 [Caerostris extrusa]|uniref:Uncharacterized protein n=1 Tax=Caerostris extrusa TaxID=172846 RepID=A0AAV4NSL0_CAEEX|nr:hypothetical protein CEXT_464261 [Caerostris extrusa]
MSIAVTLQDFLSRSVLSENVLECKYLTWNTLSGIVMLHEIPDGKKQYCIRNLIRKNSKLKIRNLVGDELGEPRKGEELCAIGWSLSVKEALVPYRALGTGAPRSHKVNVPQRCALPHKLGHLAHPRLQSQFRTPVLLLK